MSLSIGIALYPEDGTDKERMIACADASLFEAKRGGGSLVRLADRSRDPRFVYPSTILGALEGLVRSIDRKDRYTKDHSDNDAEYAVLLGQALNLSENVLSALRIAGLLHDVGKIGIPDNILKKPGPLTPEERKTMQEHVVLSDLIIKGVPHLEDVSDAVRNHHERYDGTGYPDRIKGEAIPLLGRIMAVVDAYSAMTLDRPYRKALTHERTLEELRRCAGTQFDPRLIDLFIKALEDQRSEENVA